MDIAVRLSNIIASFRLNQSKLSQLMQISQGSVSMLLKGNTAPSYQSLENLCAALPDLNPEYLLTGLGSIYKSSADNILNLPIMGQIAAGEPLSTPDIEPLKFVTLDRTTIESPDHLTCFQVIGDSMNPAIYHNDIIIISHIFDFHSLNGTICVIQIDGANTLKQIILNPTANQTILMPLNHKHHNPIILDYDTPGNITILGKLVRLIRNF